MRPLLDFKLRSLDCALMRNRLLRIRARPYLIPEIKCSYKKRYAATSTILISAFLRSAHLECTSYYREFSVSSASLITPNSQKRAIIEVPCKSGRSFEMRPLLDFKLRSLDCALMRNRLLRIRARPYLIPEIKSFTQSKLSNPLQSEQLWGFFLIENLNENLNEVLITRLVIPRPKSRVSSQLKFVW